MIDGLVSIIMPSWNTAKYIAESIQCVIDQTYKNWELIIVDDCSTDNTDEIVKSLLPLLDVIVDGEFHIKEKNLGLKFRGSENQRLIDVQRSLAEGKTILCDENNLR